MTVTALRREPLHLVMQPGEAESEGFDSFDDFKAAWEAINGSWDPMALVWRVQMELVDA
jgi:hypothetical protein